MLYSSVTLLLLLLMTLIGPHLESFCWVLVELHLDLFCCFLVDQRPVV
jgi:hypothetical protein